MVKLCLKNDKVYQSPFFYVVFCYSKLGFCYISYTFIELQEEGEKTVNSEKFERRLYMKLHVKKMQERRAVGIIVEREGSIDESACVYYRCMCGV